MKILVANHHLVNFGGTEIFNLELAKGLKRRGHEVVVYSKFINKLATFLEREELPFVSDLSLIKKRVFDIAHVHHNISAIEIRDVYMQAYQMAKLLFFIMLSMKRGFYQKGN